MALRRPRGISSSMPRVTIVSAPSGSPRPGWRIDPLASIVPAVDRAADAFERQAVAGESHFAVEVGEHEPRIANQQLAVGEAHDAIDRGAGHRTGETGVDGGRPGGTIPAKAAGRGRAGRPCRRSPTSSDAGGRPRAASPTLRA